MSPDEKAFVDRPGRVTSQEPIHIRRIATGGDGVGKLDDGMTVFVPRTAPDDRVTVKNVVRHARFARAVLDRVIAPAPARVDARCRHYDGDRCGGCQLQHVAVPAAREVKRQIVGDALRRVGRFEVTDPPIEPAIEDWRYRTRITLAADPVSGRIGYHELHRPSRIFSLVDCEIADPSLMALWHEVRVHQELLPRATERITLQLDGEGGRHLVVAAGESDAWTTAGRLERALNDAGVGATIWWQPGGGAVRIVAGERSRFRAGVFEQIYPAMADRIRAYAIDRLGAVSGRAVWDLYAGIGETTDRLVQAGARVESVEIDRRAVALAEERTPHGPLIRRVTGSAEREVGGLARPDLVITNPPRTGMESAVIDTISRHRPERIVYVSCDPATLARDLRRLVDRMPDAAITDLRAFDLFPQTAHVETVAVLERA
jgi:23S rRNA (uracil1939-C5)-methyltransferase